MLPTRIYHADWGTAANKRWKAQATLGADGHYTAYAPSLITNHKQLISLIRRDVGQEGCALVGFDFPIGLPEQYARAAGIKNFKSLLLQLGAGQWADFFRCG